jgi:uncharacterized membrane protein
MQGTQGTKGTMVSFRISKEEKEHLIKKSKKINTSISNYCRYAVLNKKVNYISGIKDVLPELNRIGNNLNQIAYKLNSRAIFNADFENIRLEFEILLGDIYAVMKGDDVDSNH